MAFRDLYDAYYTGAEADLVDVATEGGPLPATGTVVYRLGFRSAWLGDLPEDLVIGGVAIHREVGPVRTQVTEMRQRPGPDLVWDKRMVRGVEVGHGQWLTICEIPSPVPDDPAQMMVDWRNQAQGALGVLASILDERVAIEEVLEDLIFLRNGEPVAAADMRAKVRAYRPYRVTEAERDALDRVSQTEAMTGEVASAARWYLRGAQQGPTPDGVIFLWISLETLSPAKSTNPRVIEAELVQAGWDLSSLPISVGRLAGLRADIVHKGTEEHELVSEGFYILEAIVRTVLRQRLALASTWPPQVNANLFRSPWFGRIEHSQAHARVEWHDDPLSDPEVPEEVWDIEWDPPLAQEQIDNADPQVVVSGTTNRYWEHRLIHWLREAAHRLPIANDPILVEIDDDFEAQIGVNETRIAVRSDLLANAEPIHELRLAWLLHGALAQHYLMAAGMPSDGQLGSLLLELAGEWCKYREFVLGDAPITEDDLVVRTPVGEDYFLLGGHVGAAAAGSHRAQSILAEWRDEQPQDGGLVELVDDLVRVFTQATTPSEVFDGVLAFLRSNDSD